MPRHMPMSELARRVLVAVIAAAAVQLPLAHIAGGMALGATLSPSCGNVLPNPSFESSDLAGWSSWQGALAQSPLSSAPDGSYVARIASGGSDYSLERYPAVSSTIAGVPWSGSAYVAAGSSSAEGKPVILAIREWNSNGIVNEATTSSALSTSFQHLTVSYTPLYSGDVLDIYVLQYNGSSGDAFYADMVTLAPVTATCASPPPAGAAFVQGSASSTSDTSLGLNLSADVKAGDLLVGTFRAPAGTSVRDQLNGSWTEAIAAPDGINSVWYKANAAAGPTTITVTSSSSGPIRADVAEYSGVATSNALDATACNSFSSTTTPTTGSAASLTGGELAYIGLGTFTSPLIATAGSSGGVAATMRNQTTGTDGTSAEEDVTSTAAGVQDGSMQLSAGADGTACIATFATGAAAPPTPTPTPPPTSAEPTWFGTFACGCIDSSLYAFTSFIPGHAFVTLDPEGSGQQVLEEAVSNSDEPYSGSPPRADVFSPYLFTDPSDFYISVPIKIPTGLPLANDTGSSFLQWCQIDKPGEPSNPIAGCYLKANGDTQNHYEFRFMNTGFTYPSQPWYYDVADWEGPRVDGKWHTIIIHVHFTTSTSGTIDLWWDGVRQAFNAGAEAGAQTATGVTLQCANYICPPGLDIDQYRALNWDSETVAIYHGAPAIGPTLESVEGTLANGL